MFHAILYVCISFSGLTLLVLQWLFCCLLCSVFLHRYALAVTIYNGHTFQWNSHANESKTNGFALAAPSPSPPPLSPFLAIVISNAFVCENIKILFAEIYASKRLLYYKIEWLRFDICGAIEKPD